MKYNVVADSGNVLHSNVSMCWLIKHDFVLTEEKVEEIQTSVWSKSFVAGCYILRLENRMDEQMIELCRENQVKFFDLCEKIASGLEGHDIAHFTDGELRVLLTSLEIAAGI